MMKESDFVADSLWSPRVSAEYLSREVGPVRSWQQWLANDRVRTKPLIPFEKFCGHSVLYKRTDIERVAKDLREKM